MGTSTSKPKYQFHVVVVGGGYAGVTVATQLDQYCQVTLIDPKDAFHHSVGSLRSVVEPAFIKKIFIPYENSLANGTFIQSKCVSVHLSLKKVTLSNSQELEYDYLVFACGSSVPFPGKVPLGMSKDDAQKLYENLAQEVENSNKVVVIGGGPVGVELAGEIATDYPNKNVTIIHSRDRLIDDRMSAKFLKKIHNAVKAMKITTVLGEKVILDDLDFDGQKPWISGPVTLTTDKGTSIEADIVFRCTGFKVNADAYRSKLSDKMDHNTGTLKVNQFLQVEEMKEVFAVGDCTNTDELKLAYTAGMHGELVAFNIKQLNEGKKLKEYKSPRAMMVVPIGRNGGVTQLPSGAVAGSLFTRSIKGKGLFASRYWKLMSKKMPS